MVGMRELGNMGYMYQDEQEMANSNTRRKRSCTMVPKPKMEDALISDDEGEEGHVTKQAVQLASPPRTPAQMKRTPKPRVKLTVKARNEAVAPGTSKKSPKSPKAQVCDL